MIKDMPHVTVEQVLELRKAAVSMEEALNTLLESVRLCRDCNVHLDSLNDAVDNAEKVLEGKG